MYDILCTADDNAPTLWHQTTVFMMSHPLQAGLHSPSIRHHTHSIYVIIPSPLTSHPLLYYITPTFCVSSYELYITSHPILMSSHSCNYDITNSINESTSSMRATYTLNMWYHSHYLGHHTYYIDNITPNLFMTSHSPYVWHRLHYTRHHILPFWPQTTIWGHHTHYIRDRVQCICVITPTISMISQPICVWYHIQYMWDILSTIFITSYTLCMTSQPCVLITQHSVYVWFHLRYRRRHIHSITTS